MNIFVANLNYQLQEDELGDLFESYGAVDSVKIILDRDTGRSRGFGFVEMADDEEAGEAIKALNGHELSGRELVVKEAEERRERSNSRRFWFYNIEDRTVCYESRPLKAGFFYAPVFPVFYGTALNIFWGNTFAFLYCASIGIFRAIDKALTAEPAKPGAKAAKI